VGGCILFGVLMGMTYEVSLIYRCLLSAAAFAVLATVIETMRRNENK
jgi:hypothetical protein